MTARLSRPDGAWSIVLSAEHLGSRFIVQAALVVLFYWLAVLDSLYCYVGFVVFFY